MANIIGATITLEEFLGNQEGKVKIEKGIESQQLFSLKANREYVIPYFQREIRWGEENVIELISDISNGDKFLGNIILSNGSDEKYQLIDGQQRITTLFMIIQYLKEKYGENIEILTPCTLEIMSFSKFSVLLNCNFSPSEEQSKEIDGTDDYKQRKHYTTLWNAIASNEILNSRRAASIFVKNLNASEINIIMSTGESLGIQYFLDVNLKGVRLDTEDIFKGYLFGQDTSEDIRNSWKKLKKLTFDLEDQKVKYPLMKIIEQYFYCDLYLDKKYERLKFNEKFLLKEKITIDGDVFYAKEHLLKVIMDKKYMQESIDIICRYLECVLEIINSSGPSNSFKEYFKCDNKIDIDEITVIHGLLKQLLKEQVVVPKILAMKYIIYIMLNIEKKKVSKKEIRYIYGIYTLAVFFAIFEDKKNSDSINSIIKEKDWYNKVLNEIENWFSHANVNKKQIAVEYKYNNRENCEDQKYRCKSLATIFNYFNISKGSIGIRSGKIKELLTFITNTEEYSIEHYIINDGGKYIITIDDVDKEYEYPRRIKKYANSLFNFLFISRQDNAAMGNNLIGVKLNKVEEKDMVGKCSYSKAVYEIIKTSFAQFPDITKIKEHDEAYKKVNKYFEEIFEEEYSEYVEKIAKRVMQHLK